MMGAHKQYDDEQSAVFIKHSVFFFRQAFACLTLLLICITVLLPSGSIFGTNVKLLLSAACFILAFTVLLTGVKVNRYLVNVLSGFSLFLVFYLFRSIINDIPIVHVMTHILAVLSPLAIIYFALLSVSWGVTDFDQIVRVTLRALICFSVAKIVIVLMIYGGVSAEVVRRVLLNVFGASFIGLDTGLFYRVHFPIDYLLPIATYVCIKCRDNGMHIGDRILLNVYISVFMVAIVISYSRMLYVYSAITLLLAFVFRRWTRRRALGGLVVIFIVSPYFLALFDSLVAFIETRYLGDFAESSDSTRREMFAAMLRTIELNPFLGRGFGADAMSYVNIEHIPWYFELQWLSFIMHFGIFGFLVILTVTLISVIYCFRGQGSVRSLDIVIIYLGWLFVGMFNGFMLTSAGGVIFLFFTCLLFRKKIEGYDKYLYSTAD